MAAAKTLPLAPHTVTFQATPVNVTYDLNEYYGFITFTTNASCLLRFPDASYFGITELMLEPGTTRVLKLLTNGNITPFACDVYLLYDRKAVPPREWPPIHP